MKILHNVQFTSVTRTKWGIGNDESCPLCSNHRDSTSHYYYCDHKLMKERKNKLRSELVTLLEKKETDVLLARVVMDLFDMNRCTNVTEYEIFPTLPDELKNAFVDQMEIGVDLFKLGIISNKFGEYQINHHTGNVQIAVTWSKILIRKLFAISRELWKFRCSILHEENETTLDRMYRRELWTLHQSLQKSWWKFSPRDRQLVEKNQEFFLKGSSRVIDMWRQQVLVAQESAFFQATVNVSDIRTFFPVRPRIEKVKKKVSLVDLVPTQVTYRQTKLTKSPSRIEELQQVRKQKYTVQRKKPLSSRITKWLVRKNSKVKDDGNGDGKIKNILPIGVQKLNVYKEGVRSRSAVLNELDTRKIKCITN